MLLSHYTESVILLHVYCMYILVNLISLFVYVVYVYYLQVYQKSGYFLLLFGLGGC